MSQAKQDKAWATKASIETHQHVKNVSVAPDGRSLSVDLKSSALPADLMEQLANHGDVNIPHNHGDFDRGSGRFNIMLRLD